MASPLITLDKTWPPNPEAVSIEAGNPVRFEMALICSSDRLDFSRAQSALNSDGAPRNGVGALVIEPAIAFARKARARNPGVYIPHMLVAAALALHDEFDEAAAALAEGIRLRPQFNSLARLRAYTAWAIPIIARSGRRL